MSQSAQMLKRVRPVEFYQSNKLAFLFFKKGCVPLTERNAELINT